MAPDQAGSDAAARRIDVAPHRLSRWIESFAERHGAVSAESDGATVTFLAADGSVALCQVPFPPLAVEAPAGEPVPVGGTGPAGLAERIAAHAMADRTVGVLLVRLGGYAAGVFTGTEPALAASKVGSRLVHGRSAAGGTSQRRFARRRENQAHQALAAAADTAAAVFGPYAGRLDAVVLGEYPRQRRSRPGRLTEPPRDGDPGEPDDGAEDQAEGEQPVVLADTLAARASERCVDLHGLEVTRPAVPRARPR